MSVVVEALRLPLSQDLSGFVGLLRHLRVPCRVSVEGDQQVLRVPDAAVEQVRELYARYPDGGAVPVAEQPRRCGGFIAALRASPLTAVVLIVTLLAALITQLGDNFATIRWLNSSIFASTASTSISPRWSRRWRRDSGGGCSHRCSCTLASSIWR